MRAIYTAMRTNRETAELWERAYYELSDRSEEFRVSVEMQMTSLNEQFDRERAAWRSASHRSRSPGFGIFAGVGIVPGGFEPVVGAGIVWRIW